MCKRSRHELGLCLHVETDDGKVLQDKFRSSVQSDKTALDRAKPAPHTLTVSTQTDFPESTPSVKDTSTDAGSQDAAVSAKLSLPKADEAAANIGMEIDSVGCVVLQLPNGPPRMPGFEITPLSTCQFFLMEHLRHWNCSRGDCCPLHEATSVCNVALDKIQRSACNPFWSPFGGGQCPRCSTLWEDSSEYDVLPVCETCGIQKFDTASWRLGTSGEVSMGSEGSPSPAHRGDHDRWQEWSSGTPSSQGDVSAQPQRNHD